MREKAPLTGGRVCASWQPPRQQRSLSSKCTLRAAALPEAAGYVLKCMLSPDVRQLATTSSDKTVKLWNLDGFTLDRTLAGGWAARPWSVRAGAGSAGAAPASGARRARAARAAELVRLVALAPRPRPPNLQAAGAGWGLRAPCCPCWLQPPIPACGARQPLPPPPPPPTRAGHQRWVWDCVFSVDAAYLVTASSDCTARLWCAGSSRACFSLHQPETAPRFAGPACPTLAALALPRREAVPRPCGPASLPAPPPPCLRRTPAPAFTHTPAPAPSNAQGPEHGRRHPRVFWTPQGHHHLRAQRQRDRGPRRRLTSRRRPPTPPAAAPRSCCSSWQRRRPRADAARRLGAHRAARWLVAHFILVTIHLYCLPCSRPRLPSCSPPPPPIALVHCPPGPCPPASSGGIWNSNSCRLAAHRQACACPPAWRPGKKERRGLGGRF